jgi:uncharacterized protein (AIM24 family)
MNQEIMGFKTGFLAGGAGQLVFNRFTGPGRICLQSMYYRPPDAGGAQAQDQSPMATGARILGGILGG